MSNMQAPTLSKVPNPQFPGIQDIIIWTLSTASGPIVLDQDFCGSSLEGQRLISDFFNLLDHVIVIVTDTTADESLEYELQKVDEKCSPLPGPPIRRSSPGNIAAGIYLLKPSAEGAEILLKNIATFSTVVLPMATGSPLRHLAKRPKTSGGGYTISEQSGRDSSDDGQGFKMRLVYRDKGCAVCLAAGIQAVYKYREDSNHFEGAHIIGLAHYELWDTRGFSALIRDPFTDPVNAQNSFASPSTHTGKDFRRINSLENGILLCLEHHRDYDSFRFAIHHKTHKIFAFHPATAKLQGIEVSAPWECQDMLYPSPHAAFLEMHYITSIAKAMKGGADEHELDDDTEEYELDDDTEDYEEVSEVSEVKDNQDDNVRIWLDGIEILALPNPTEGSKGRTEIVADIPEVVSP